MSNKIKIVVVDDHQMFLDGMISILSAQENFDVLFVETSAKKVLERIEKKLPDIIITDISMPEMNGIELVAVLNKNYPDIKILILSMFEDQHMTGQIDGYLLKETNKDLLVEVINEIVVNNKKFIHTDSNGTDNNKEVFLTRKEKEIVRLITNGKSSDQIADILFNSKSTIETHRKNIFLKLQVTNIANLINKAIYLGISK